MTRTCAICGDPVAGRTRLEGFTAWENSAGERALREVVADVHTECYMRLSPDERDALLADATEDADRGV